MKGNLDSEEGDRGPRWAKVSSKKEIKAKEGKGEGHEDSLL